MSCSSIPICFPSHLFNLQQSDPFPGSVFLVEAFDVHIGGITDSPGAVTIQGKSLEARFQSESSVAGPKEATFRSS